MARSLPARSDVLKLLASEDRAFHAKEIAKELDVPDVKYEGLVRLLDNLTFDGVVDAKDGHKFKLASRGAQRRGGGQEATRQGIVSVNARGFGFVSSIGAAGDDVFVSAEALRGAMHGDTVKVSVRARGTRGPEGEILEIVDRGAKRVSGVLRRRGRSAWLEPDDTRVRGPITLPSDIDTREGEGNSGKDGDAVIVVITRWPELPDENPVGKIEVVLGRPGELSVESAKILAMAQVEEVHSALSFAEAEAYGPTVPTELLAGREDLTHLPLPTIDPEDARDHDDAVWVERNAEGGFTAWIAIADVSTYVRPGTALDEESKKRGVSIYLPDRAIPMLPRPLSSNLCSLLPDVVRLCLCVEVKLDSAGKVLGRRMIRGFMKSQAKLTYGGVARALGFSEIPPVDPRAEHFVAGLRVANELALMLRGQRMKRGALDFDLPEAKIILGEDGKPTDVQRRAADPGMKKAYSLVEELMLLANEVVAGWLVEKQIPTIFRIHEAPDEKKLGKLAIMCEALGVPFDMEDAKDPKLLSAMLKRFTEHPLVDVLNMLLLRSMKQAAYDIRNLGHFGLASKAYLHFTSPIRRYPDLVVHRSVHAAVLEEKIDKSEKAIATLSEAALAASGAERKAMEVERDVVDLYRAVLMRDRVGEKLEGRVTALVGSGVFVALDNPFVDVLVKLEDLGRETYSLDDNGLKVTAARSGDVVQLGDRMLLEIIDVAIQRRTVYGRRISSADSGERRPPKVHGKQAGRDQKGKPGRQNDSNRGRGNKGPKGQKPQKSRGGGKKGKKGRR